MADVPAGMSTATFDYTIEFTVHHEGNTPFMYNNWPLKNPNRDVTVGVGQALHTENDAAAPDIVRMFTVKATGLPATADDLRREFRRVFNLPRTADNLWTAYQDQSPLKMDPAAMRRSLKAQMLGYWAVHGAQLPNFATIPAQAQVALMSYNYGLRLSRAPEMCKAIREANFVRAADQSLIRGWSNAKNAAHKRLLLNAAAIAATGLDAAALPGKVDPVPEIAGAPTTLNTIHRDLAGQWAVVIGNWKGVFRFDAQGNVSWAEQRSATRHAGRWAITSDRLEWKFRDPGDFRTFVVKLPLRTANADGTILPAGQGWFSMSKEAGSVA